MRIRIMVWAIIALALSAALLAVAPMAMKAAHVHWPAWPFALAAAVITALAALAQPLTAVITRSWADHAQERIKRRDQRRQIEREITSKGNGLPFAGEVTHRAVLGIHPAIPLPIGADPQLSPDLPLYVGRDIDPDLRAWIAAHQETGGFLLITGPAASGKTRTAHELIRETLPDWPLLMPANAGQLSAYIDATPAPAKLVVWLNETQDYLGPDGLTAATVRRILAAPQPLIIVGTIWPDRFDALTSLHAPSALPDGSVRYSAQHDPGRDAREILTFLADRRDLADGFSPAEQDRAGRLATRDPRIAEALAQPGSLNLPEMLAAAPQLISRWLAGTGPYGAAVITAAVAARRCGHPEPVSPEVLRSVAQHALTPAQLAGASPEWFSEALTWAREPVRGNAAPLTPQAEMPAEITGDRVSDILVQHAARNATAPWHHIPGSVWLLLTEHASPAACQHIATTAYPHRYGQEAHIVMRAARKAADLRLESPGVQLLGLPVMRLCCGHDLPLLTRRTTRSRSLPRTSDLQRA